MVMVVCVAVVMIVILHERCLVLFRAAPALDFQDRSEFVWFRQQGCGLEVSAVQLELESLPLLIRPNRLQHDVLCRRGSDCMALCIQEIQSKARRNFCFKDTQFSLAERRLYQRAAMRAVVMIMMVVVVVMGMRVRMCGAVVVRVFVGEVDIELYAFDACLVLTRDVQVVTVQFELLQFVRELVCIHAQIDQCADKHIAADAAENVQVERLHCGLSARELIWLAA